MFSVFCFPSFGVSAVRSRQRWLTAALPRWAAAGDALSAVFSGHRPPSHLGGFVCVAGFFTSLVTRSVIGLSIRPGDSIKEARAQEIREPGGGGGGGVGVGAIARCGPDSGNFAPT